LSTSLIFFTMELDNECEMDDYLLNGDPIDTDAIIYHNGSQSSAEAEASFRGRASTWDPSFKRRQHDAAAAAAAAASASPSSSSAATDVASSLDEPGPSYLQSGSLFNSQFGSGTANSSTSAAAAAAAAVAAAQKRRNAWGNQSYAELITQAIQSSPNGRLTLAEIYDWMVRHVPYFTARSDSASSAGWKNSVRHNLSLHNKFVRVQNDQSGKSSYWTINREIRDRASYRRRAATAETRSGELLHKRQLALAKQRARTAAAAAAAASSAVGAFSEASPPPPPKQQQQQHRAPSAAPLSAPATPMQRPPMPRTLSVTEVMRDLVPPEQLLDHSRTTEDLLLESLTDAVLQEACPEIEQQQQMPMQELANQLNQLSCRQQLSDSSIVSPQLPPQPQPPQLLHQQYQHQLHRQSSASAGMWFNSDLGLPDIQEAAEQPSSSGGCCNGGQPQQLPGASSQLQQYDLLMEEFA
ncbi:hypothetical protein BOX15_Mlig022853g3, partial [Macrostomum lignano]